MTALEQESIDPLRAIADCMLGMQHQLAAMADRIDTLEARSRMPATADLEGLRQMAAQIEQTWTRVIGMESAAHVQTSRIGELSESLDLALLALPTAKRATVYRTREERRERSQYRWGVAGD